MKFNVGDKVRVKENLSQCKFGGSTYMNEYAGKEATVTETYDSGLIKLDIDDGEWNWSECVLELIVDSEKKMRRIDYVLNAKDPIKVLVEEFDLGLDCCECHYDDECDGISVNCNDGFIKYLEQEIEVNESDLKDVEVKEEVDTKENIVNDTVNPFMEEYEKIVMDTMELCKRKNKDYGNATDESFKQFGDVSYLVRCFDKWSRINTLLKNRKAEVSESLEDSLLDLSNYLFLWVTSRRLKENN